MKTLKRIAFSLFSLFSHKKVAILRDLKNNVSILYKNPTEADIVIKNECDHKFNFNEKPDVQTQGFSGKVLKDNLVLMIVDIHTALKNTILTDNEKQLIVKAMSGETKDLLVST